MYRLLINCRFLSISHLFPGQGLQIGVNIGGILLGDLRFGEIGHDRGIFGPQFSDEATKTQLEAGNVGGSAIVAVLAVTGRAIVHQKPSLAVCRISRRGTAAAE